MYMNINIHIMVAKEIIFSLSKEDTEYTSYFETKLQITQQSHLDTQLILAHEGYFKTKAVK